MLLLQELQLTLRFLYSQDCLLSVLHGSIRCFFHFILRIYIQCKPYTSCWVDNGMLSSYLMQLLKLFLWLIFPQYSTWSGSSARRRFTISCCIIKMAAWHSVWMVQEWYHFMIDCQPSQVFWLVGFINEKDLWKILVINEFLI